MVNGLEKVRAQRLTFLRALYDASEGSTRAMVRMDDIGAELGLDRQRSAQIADYLADEGLLRFAAAGPLLEITHWGVKEIEEALTAPDQPTEHFPSFVVAQNYLHIDSMTHSQVQQGTVASSQAQQALDVEALVRLVVELRAIISALDLEVEQGEEYEAELNTISAQLGSPQPKTGILSESLRSVRSILEGAASSGVAAVAPNLPGLIEQVARMIAALPR